MTGHLRIDDDRELDLWVHEVTDGWQVPRLRSDQVPWQHRVVRPPSRDRSALAAVVRLFGAMAGAAAVVALVGFVLLWSLPVAPDPGTGGGDEPRGEGSDALFALTIEAGRSRYAVDEPIGIATRLRYIGDEPVIVTSSGAGLVAFAIEQLDGPVDAGWARNDDCARFDYRPGDIEPVEFQKSGGYSNDDPMADFWRTFYAEPELRLPAGEYRITARAEYGDPDCSDFRTVEASIVIVVE